MCAVRPPCQSRSQTIEVDEPKVDQSAHMRMFGMRYVCNERVVMRGVTSTCGSLYSTMVLGLALNWKWSARGKKDMRPLPAPGINSKGGRLWRLGLYTQHSSLLIGSIGPFCQPNIFNTHHRAQFDNTEAALTF